MEDLQIVEHVVRVNPKVIEQCVLSGIPKEDMHKVYCDRRLSILVRSSNSKLTAIQPGRSASTNVSATKSDYSKL